MFKESTKIEVSLKVSKYDKLILEQDLKDFLKNLSVSNENDTLILNIPESNGNLAALVSSISAEKSKSVPWNFESPEFYFFKASSREAEIESFEDGGDGEEVPASNHWILPSTEFLSLWENLIYEDGLKEKLLKFTRSAILFAKRNVNQNIISCNRIILLHGPPGTGKTSLCKAIAQKLSIRLNSVFRHTHLIEINSHSLFSKWFSESGKLVMKLFAKVREIVSQPNSLVCVLIDEVESIAYARSSMSGQEPKDAMRVVNALLTQLDSLKNYPNVIILATSNLASTIDLAFIDRADIKQFIGFPSVKAVYEIYRTMLLELERVGILNSADIPVFENSGDCSLRRLSEKSKGLSGRTLRKLPYLAHAVHLDGSDNGIDLEQFIEAISEALDKHKNDHDLLSLEDVK